MNFNKEHFSSDKKKKSDVDTKDVDPKAQVRKAEIDELRSAVKDVDELYVKKETFEKEIERLKKLSKAKIDENLSEDEKIKKQNEKYSYKEKIRINMKKLDVINYYIKRLVTDYLSEKEREIHLEQW